MKWVFKTEYQPPPARPVKAVSLKKICCFFVARLRSRPFCPVRIVVVSERNIFLPRRLAFLIFVRSKKQRENCPFRLANFKTRWCGEWKEKFSAPPVAKISFPALQKRKKIWENSCPAGSWRPLKCIFSGKGKSRSQRAAKPRSGVILTEEKDSTQRAGSPALFALYTEKPGQGQSAAVTEQVSTTVPKSAILRFCPSRETCWGVPSPNPAMVAYAAKIFPTGEKFFLTFAPKMANR